MIIYRAAGGVTPGTSRACRWPPRGSPGHRHVIFSSVCVCVCVCMYVYVCVCMCVCVCIYIYIYIYVYMNYA